MIRIYVVLLAALLSALPAFSADLCAACGKRLGGTFYRMPLRGQTQRVLVCDSCMKLELRCFICGLPVTDKSHQLIDGRSLCETHNKQAVLTQEEATDIFNDVKRDVQSLLAQMGPLPHQNITLKLEAKARLDTSGGDIISGHGDSLLMGLTRSRRKSEGEFVHEIFLLYGLTRARMISVSAHEYGHAWVHENVKRTLNKDTHEGFCDFLAYKIISQKNEPEETKILLESNYSHGQLQAFIAAEKEYGFYPIIQWMKKGVDTEVDLNHLENIHVLRDGKAFAGPSSSDSASIFGAIPVAARVNPTTLVLKGLSGSASRRFAMINDGTFMPNEQGKVRLGDSNVVVRCLEIRNDSVVIQVAGEAEPRTLALKQQ